MLPRKTPKRRLVAIYGKLNEEARGRLVLTMLDVLPMTAEQCEVLVDQFNEESDPAKRREIFFQIADLYCGEETEDGTHNSQPTHLRAYEGRQPHGGYSLGVRRQGRVP